MTRTGYLSDVSNDGWAFVAPRLCRDPDAGRRTAARIPPPGGVQRLALHRPYRHAVAHDAQLVYAHAAVACGLPADPALRASVFEGMVRDLRMLIREINGRMQQPRAAILDSRTLQSTPESGAEARRCTWRWTPWGPLLAILVTLANEQDRAQVGELTRQIQEATCSSVELAFMDQGYTGDVPAAAAEEHGIRLEVVKLPTAKRGLVPSACCLAAGWSSAALPCFA